MSEIIITDQNGEVVAQGELGSSVIAVEGNYYFLPESVNSSIIQESSINDTYHCPIKKGVCQYYNLINEAGKVISKQVAWNYHKVENSLFLPIENRIGFYGKDMRNGLDVTEVDMVK